MLSDVIERIQNERRQYFEEGMEIGEARGREEGREEVMRNNARNMAKEGFAVEVIAKILNMPRSWVEEHVKIK